MQAIIKNCANTIRFNPFENEIESAVCSQSKSWKHGEKPRSRQKHAIHNGIASASWTLRESGHQRLKKQRSQMVVHAYFHRLHPKCVVISPSVYTFIRECSRTTPQELPSNTNSAWNAITYDQHSGDFKKTIINGGVILICACLRAAGGDDPSKLSQSTFSRTVRTKY